MKLVWNGPAFVSAIRGTIAGNLPDAGEHLRDVMKQLIGIQGPPRSDPWEPPHIDTGALEKDIDFAVDTATLTVTVGSTLDYAVYLEEGTDRMEPRPFLARTLVAWGDEAALLILHTP